MVAFGHVPVGPLQQRSGAQIAAVCLMLAFTAAQFLASPAGAQDDSQPADDWQQLPAFVAASVAAAPAVKATAHKPSRQADPMYPFSGSAGVEPESTPQSYRTVCVRLCDGYYWPVSNATSMEHFQRDRNVCEQSCQQPAKLYFQPAGDSNPALLQGIDGQPYSALDAAYAYRKALNPDCRCKPDPWSHSEIERHRLYAATSDAVPDTAAATGAETSAVGQ